MRKLYIIASVTDGVGLEIEVFYDPGMVTRRMKALVDHGFRKPKNNESPEDYHAAYYEWVREENDNTCDTDIALHIEEIPVPPATKQPADHPEDLPGKQQEMFAALQSWRKDRAQDLQKPEFMIFKDDVLLSIVQANPLTTADLAKVKGVGERKIELYGDDLLAIFNAFN